MEVKNPRRFGPLVEECAARGIKRGQSFLLQKQGLIETFKIGSKTFVVTESLDSLPERMRREAK